MVVKLQEADGVKVYNVTADKALPAWVKKTKNARLGRDAEYARHLDLIQVRLQRCVWPLLYLYRDSMPCRPQAHLLSGILERWRCARTALHAELQAWLCSTQHQARICRILAFRQRATESR